MVRCSDSIISSIIVGNQSVIQNAKSLVEESANNICKRARVSNAEEVLETSTGNFVRDPSPTKVNSPLSDIFILEIILVNA